MASKQIEVSEALAALREVVAEAGADYVYDKRESPFTCVYVYDGKPDCLVARALVRLGVPLDLLAGGEGKPVTQVPRLRDFVTYEARYVLRVAQLVQDGGSPWGVALAQAEEYVAIKAAEGARQ